MKFLNKKALVLYSIDKLSDHNVFHIALTIKTKIIASGKSRRNNFGDFIAMKEIARTNQTLNK
jgi:hypothetical protein